MYVTYMHAKYRHAYAHTCHAYTLTYIYTYIVNHAHLQMQIGPLALDHEFDVSADEANGEERQVHALTVILMFILLVE